MACCGGSCTSIETADNCGFCDVSCPGSTCYPGVCNAGFCSQALDSSCVCDADSDCDDGSGCTLSYCSYSTGACIQGEIGTCVECAGDGDCGGGVCCHGRCCAPGAICGGTGAQGLGICCLACGGTQNYSCCDQIYLDDFGGDLTFGVCVGEDPSKNLPGFCCANGNGGYAYDDNGDVVREADGTPIIWCSLPVFRR